MSSLDRWRTTGTPGHLSRRTPSNPKYDGVTSRLNTGMTVAKLNKRYAGTGGPNAHRRPTNQYFAKLKPTTLAKLVEPKMEAEESIYKVEKDDAVSTVTTMVDAMQMSDDAIKNAEVMILDCRPFEDYHACRVHGAYHYDIAQLGKATNQFPRELYFFKAPIESNKMIVIYDSGRDVEATQRLGNAFVEKGIDNTYVVHGGFHGIATRVPHILAGDVPPPYGIPGAEVLRLGSARPGSSRPTLGVLATGNSPRRPSSAGGCSTGTRDTDFSRFSNAIGASRTQLTAIGELKPWK
jgi:centrosomal protein CEP41